jgi:hypothetical protein
MMPMNMLPIISVVGAKGACDGGRHDSQKMEYILLPPAELLDIRLFEIKPAPPP